MIRTLKALCTGCIVLCSMSGAIAQIPPPTYIPETKFSSGQDVVPTFDGWIRNADGTFTMVSGYLNRNYKEELAIPAGADNKVEPGLPDRGQPTYFLPRRHAWVFRVQVPKDWGTRNSSGLLRRTAARRELSQSW